MTLQYFHRMAIAGMYPDIEDYGTYWFDDPMTKTNGKFDCVLKHSDEQYDFYECKFYDSPMPREECNSERGQLKQILGIQVSNIGFVSTSGFDFDDSKEYILIDGNMLYK